MGKNFFQSLSLDHIQSKFSKKHLGQNFLNDSLVRNKIIDLTGNIKNKNILEIGPGWGFLTSEILQRGAKLTAVELDTRCVNILKKKFSKYNNLKLIQDSILNQIR